MNYQVIKNFTQEILLHIFLKRKLFLTNLRLRAHKDIFFLCYDFIVVFLLSFLLGSPSFCPVRSCGTVLRSCCPRNRDTVSVQRCSLAGFPFSVEYHIIENIELYVSPLPCHAGIMT